jgi:putative ABC transport system permease protein
MRADDLLQFSARALRGFRTRTLLTLLAMGIGVASVMLLTALGEGARRYVVGEFSSLGTHLVIVLPGRSETTGGPPPLLAAIPRDLTLEDALALTRSSAVHRVAPISVGSAPVSWQQLEREVTILGSTAELYEVRQLSLAQGEFLPAGDPTRGAAVCVIGYTVRKELFGNQRALGQWIRVGDRRFRVIGVLGDKGQSLGMDVNDLVIIPLASAQSLFNTSSLFRILVQADGREAIPKAEKAIKQIISERHEGEDDITVITQDAVLSTFDRILTALTLTVAGIAAISLLVAGILIMNLMLVSVTQRTGEVGLLKALGAPDAQVQLLFLAEAATLSLLGAVLGLLIALIGTWVLGRVFPDFPIHIPLWALASATGVGLATGLVFGVLPARRAARLDPVNALSGR